MLFDTSAATDALEDLLDHERRMILAGQIDDLARGTRQKEQLISRLSNLRDDRALARVRAKAERNQALLAAAARGLKAARARIGQIASGGAPLRTYGCDGAATDLGPGQPKPGVNRRA
jgi:flagellar biosynthesis/type III secretory pathway chaperone